MQFSAEVVKNLTKTIDESCADPHSDIPGVNVVVVGKDGEIFRHAAGKRGVNSAEPMTSDSVFWIASCTKMITGIACMQLVEKGLLEMDDGDFAESRIPYLKDVQVLQKDGTLVPKKNKITLRMLLTHTAGFACSILNNEIRDFSHPIGFNEFSGNIRDMMQPLVFQPGEGWHYSVGVDFAGLLVEHVTGLSLSEYCHKHIFEPLGLESISWFPNADMKRRLAHMHHRNQDGSLVARDHELRNSLVVEPSEVKDVFNSGGAGCFATSSDYAQIIATLLNDGTSPSTGAKILEKATVDEMFTNQVERLPDFGRQGMPAAKPHLTNPAPELYPVEGNPPQGWGLTFMLSNGGATGRSKSAGFWAGLPNCWWWVDREKGVGGIVSSQILPFGDAKVMGLWFDIEAQVYRALDG